ncbi:MAG: L,D-transpeptidase family protein [Kiritimatiellae bacterium]|nr:L,D-transpeptidase family protein [Kiritimatiellia bacterium]
MSDDLYIRRVSSPRSRGPWWAVGLAVLAAAAALGVRWVRQRPAKPTPAPVGVPVPATNVVPSPPPTSPAPLRATAEPTPAPADPGADAVQAARALFQARQLAAARERAFQALESAREPAVRRAAEDLLGEIHIAMVFSPAPMPEKSDYVIQPGDRLATIARRFGCTVELLMKGNGLKGEVIRPGDRLRVLSGRFSVEVDKSDNELVVRLNDRFFKRYRIGTGEFDKTPTGQFTITERIAQPTWWRPDGRTVPYGDKENVLGTHWLSLNVPGYGIHGTWEPETIGRSVSAGCIRLLNSDIEELFTLLPAGTPVVIHD